MSKIKHNITLPTPEEDAAIRAGIAADEVLAYQEGLGQSIRFRLWRIAEPHAQPAAVAQQVPVTLEMPRRGDDENLPDLRQHEDAQGIEDHRLVVHGQQLLR